MFDFSLTEMMLAGVVALVVLGPERLPIVARKAGQWMGKIQSLAAGVRSELAAHAEVAELVKVKQELEETSAEIQQDLQNLSKKVEQNSQEIAEHLHDSVPAWERLPEQRTPADFGVDEHGNPLPQTESAQTEETVFDDNGQPVAPVSASDADNAYDADKAWHDYLTLSARPSETPEVSYIETLPAAPAVLHTASLRKQAMSRKRDLRPKYHAKPKLRIRKK